MDNFIKNKLIPAFKPSSFMPFIFGMSVVILGYLIHATGLRPLDLLRHQASHTEKVPVEKVIQQKILKTPKNAFYLKSAPSFIEKADAAPAVDATSYIVVNAQTGDIILSKNADSSVPIASLTKIMSAVVTLDLASPEAVFPVSYKAAHEIPTKLGLTTDQKLKVSELLQGALMTSANDAAQVLEDGVDSLYGKGAFIDAMNAKAEFLGLTHTHFSNPQGLDSAKNYSSAKDLAVLSSYALKNYPLILEIAKKDYAFLPADKNHKQFDLYNWNGLLGVYPGVTGLKIGNTGKAGYTTIVTSERGGKSLISVVLGAPDITHRDLWAAILLDQGFELLADLPPVQVTEEQLLTKYATWKYWN